LEFLKFNWVYFWFLIGSSRLYHLTKKSCNFFIKFFRKQIILSFPEIFYFSERNFIRERDALCDPQSSGKKAFLIIFFQFFSISAKRLPKNEGAGGGGPAGRGREGVNIGEGEGQNQARRSCCGGGSGN